MPTETSEEVAEEAPEPFSEEVFRAETTRTAYTWKLSTGRQPTTFPEAEEGSEVHPETVDVGKEPPSTLLIMRANAHESPLKDSHVFTCFYTSEVYLFTTSLFSNEVYQGYLGLCELPIT